MWSSKTSCTRTPRRLAASSLSAVIFSENENTAIRIVEPAGAESMVRFTWVKIRRCSAAVPTGRLKIAPVTGV